MAWKQTNYKNGSYILREMKKYIYIHESLGRYWIDYGMKEQNRISTIMVKTKKDIPKAIRDAKSDFIFQAW